MAPYGTTRHQAGDRSLGHIQAEPSTADRRSPHHQGHPRPVLDPHELYKITHHHIQPLTFPRHQESKRTPRSRAGPGTCHTLRFRGSYSGTCWCPSEPLSSSISARQERAPELVLPRTGQGLQALLAGALCCPEQARTLSNLCRPCKHVDHVWAPHPESANRATSSPVIPQPLQAGIKSEFYHNWAGLKQIPQTCPTPETRA